MVGAALRRRLFFFSFPNDFVVAPFGKEMRKTIVIVYIYIYRWKKRIIIQSQKAEKSVYLGRFHSLRLKKKKKKVLKMRWGPIYSTMDVII